jgi:S-methylmethionine-dependent homocysteine/selenocysteine methylase
MPTRSVTERLEAGEVLLMDGGTGSELQRRGVEVLLGSRGDKLGPWSATANLDAADVVQQVHQDYLRVGADVIISNNFRTTRTRLAPVGLGDRWVEYARAGGEIAVRARNAINPEAYVAGGMAAPGLGMLHERPGTDVEIMGEAAYRQEFVEHSRLLARTGVDVMLPEFVNFIADCVAAVDACAEAGLPVWLGVPTVTTDGITRNGETMDGLANALRGHPVQAILLMCSRPEAISATLPRLRQAFDGPIGAYPNVGYNPMAPVGGRVHLGPNLTSAQAHSPSRLAEFAGEWIEMGAQVVGGCCATGPEHIMAMRAVVSRAGHPGPRSGRVACRRSASPLPKPIP